MNTANHTVPVGVEKPVPVFVWEPVEFVFSMAVLGFGMVTDAWPLGFIGAGGILIGTLYLRRGAKKGAVQHMLWSHGLAIDPCLTRFFPGPERNDFFE